MTNRTEFTSRDIERLHELAKETVEKFVGKDMLSEWGSLRLLSDKVWENRFYQAFYSTLREYFDWYDGVHQDCPYCTAFDIEETTCPVCQGRGWID